MATTLSPATHPAPANLRRVLGVFLAFWALNAAGGGIYGLSGADSVPKEWLEGTPLTSYLIPSLVLLVVVGGTLASAAVAALGGSPSARLQAQAAGGVLLVWITAQVGVLGYVSWIQPVTAVSGVLILALAGALPRQESAFARYYTGMFLRPRRTLDRLMADPRRMRHGLVAVITAVALYTGVYVFLFAGGGAPSTFTPWLAIPARDYYFYDMFLLAPSMFGAWLLASSVAHLLARAVGGCGSFEDTASALGFGVAVASWVTGLHDLVAGLLGTLGVISLAEHEVAMNSPTVWRTLIWTLMILYLIAFGVLFTKGVGASHRLGPARSAGIGIAAFVVYQAMFLVFNR